LWEHYALGALKVKLCLYIDEKSASGIQNCPHDATAVLGGEFFLESVYLLDFKRGIDFLEAVVIVTVGSK
jgi:hypothetical protein